MKNTLKTLLAVASLAAVTSASAIVYDASVDGLVNPAGTFTATGGDLVVDTIDGVTFLGVEDPVYNPALDRAGSEIDLGQSVTVNFSEPSQLISITLGLLFNGPEYRDVVEVARLTANGGTSYTLSITGEDTAVWSNGGVVVPVMAPFSTTYGGGGVFKIVNPFGSLAISSLLLEPVDNSNEANNSDFGLVAFEVPDSGATLALLGLALAGISIVHRRRR
ncbi:VPDSG-CTERM sorting domain-containing protein [Pelagicoccus sp. NFK12]|uniref:VPDSG-CTERM sorting domain-containing protein n=1 Tax=Pelagicoccus enzymogenes TaxID=2773457 RepID=A0A927FF09_9BACT|nr:VPDSG-CTERM sorting domain-containing protein [Pelagicoccus enzymogenes]MBD5782193.1 VPDSG-CTERM sorting domain-containing protein [Pelagicoccus enzymogenes]